MKNKLPPCFAFRNSGKHPRKDEIKKRFNELDTPSKWGFGYAEIWYGRNESGNYTCNFDSQLFGSTVVEITEDDFLAMTEPELTELPKVFAFKNDPDSPNHDLLVERFNSPVNPIQYDLVRKDYYGRHENGCVTYNYRLEDFGDSVVEITEQQFLDLTEPEKKVEPESDFPYKGDIKDFPKEVVEWMLDNQVKQGNKRDISVFEAERQQDKTHGGIHWDETIEGEYFCRLVVGSREFATFFQKYPNYPHPTAIASEPHKTTPITGQIIEISERGILIELTKEQIKEFKIFETVTIK
jgi:hypothetical protein